VPDIHPITPAVLYRQIFSTEFLVMNFNIFFFETLYSFFTRSFRKDSFVISVQK